MMVEVVIGIKTRMKRRIFKKNGGFKGVS